jgi:hypothetical protein
MRRHANICSITSQGHPYAIFRRAIERRNLVAAWAAAAELPAVPLADALALCLLVRDRDPTRFPRFALRWHARFCAETPAIGLEDGRLVLDLLTAVGGAEPQRADGALRELLASYDAALAESVREWTAMRGDSGPQMPSPANPRAHRT